MKIFVSPNLNIRIILRSRRGEPIEVELTDEGAPVGVLEILREILLSKNRLVVDFKRRPVLRKCGDLRVLLVKMCNEMVGLC